MDDLNRAYHEWQDAEADADAESADAAFESVFRATAAAPRVTPQFITRTMTAVAAARETDGRRARRVRVAALWGGSIGVGVAAYFGAGLAVSVTVTALVATIDFVAAAILQAVDARDWNMWSMLSTIGRALAAVISSPTVTVAIIAIQGIAVAALIALQRLLGPEAESFE
jgi:hypothetical protein